MAIKLRERYATRANEASIDYPTGSFKNKSSPIAVDGTPLEKDWANDWIGARDAILKRADITASGDIETAEVSDVLASIESIINEYIQVVTDNLPLRGVAVYDTSGVYAWAVPEGVTKAQVTVVGGGGGGGAAVNRGAGGGAGGCGIGIINLFGVDSVDITVGEGGSAEAGLSSSFGSYISASGGDLGSSSNNNAAGGQGGDGVGGDINIPGGMGSDGGSIDAYSQGSGDGGSSYFGGGSRGASDTSGPGIAPRAPGSGGGGNRSSGSKGANGIVIVRW